MTPFWACRFLFNGTIVLFCRWENWVIEFKRLTQSHTARKWWDQIWTLAIWIQSPCSKPLYYMAEGWGKKKEGVRKGGREGGKDGGKERDRQTHTNTHTSYILKFECICWNYFKLSPKDFNAFPRNWASEIVPWWNLVPEVNEEWTLPWFLRQILSG